MIRVETYIELQTFTTGFANDHFDMLVIAGRGATGKSEESGRALAGHTCVEIPGHVTPLDLYRRLYEGKDQKVVFDEIDGLYDNKKSVCIIKQLGETRDEKRISYMSSDRRAQEIDGGKGFFFTKSRLLILCNSFTVLNANVAALATRAVVVHFAPTPEEILKKIKTFGTDLEIIAFLESHYECLPEFNLRSYRNLENMKAAGLDWRMYAMQESDVSPKVIEIADLLVRYSSDLDRLLHYSASRRDYYNWKPEAMALAHRRVVAEAEGLVRPKFTTDQTSAN